MGFVETLSRGRRHADRPGVEIVLALVAAGGAFVLAALVSAAVRGNVPTAPFALILLIAILAVAHWGGVLYAVPVGVAVINAFDWYFLPPLRVLDGATGFILGLFLLVSVLVGLIASHAERRAIASEGERGALAEEQAALRRVATLVAHQPAPDEVFALVAEEVGRLLRLDLAQLLVYEGDGMATVRAAWSAEDPIFEVGRRVSLEGDNVAALALRLRRPVRMDDYSDAQGPVAAFIRSAGLRAAVGSPIVVGGRIWGVMTASSFGPDPIPAGTEARMGAFTELVATAIANAEARTEIARLADERTSALAASRARVVAAADAERRRLERDLHDGIQQRLVSLALEVRCAESAAPAGFGELHGHLSRIREGLSESLEELRELSRGIHPAILSEGGLEPALKALARRSPVAVELDADVKDRLPEPVEVAAYYVVSEALANAGKHAHASMVLVDVVHHHAMLRLAIRDDGAGGADPSRGSGLLGLRDRVEALGGRIEIASAVGEGTSLLVRIPSDAA